MPSESVVLFLIVKRQCGVEGKTVISEAFVLLLRACGVLSLRMSILVFLAVAEKLTKNVVIFLLANKGHVQV